MRNSNFIILASISRSQSISQHKACDIYRVGEIKLGQLSFFTCHNCSSVSVLCGTGILPHLSIPIPSHSRVTIPVPTPFPKLHVVHSHSHWIPMGRTGNGNSHSQWTPLTVTTDPNRHAITQSNDSAAQSNWVGRAIRTQQTSPAQTKTALNRNYRTSALGHL